MLLGKTLILLPESNMLSTQNEHCKLPIPHMVGLVCTKETLYTPTLLLPKGLLRSGRPLNSCSGAMEIE